MADLIRLSQVKKTYGTDVPVEALRGIDLVWQEGEFSSLIGRSGSGKSTLLHLLGALDRPTSGVVQIDGQVVTALDENQLASFRNRTIGFIFQFHHLLPEFTALENVLLPYRISRGRVPPEVEKEAQELLARVGVGHRIHNRSPQLSGGEQQRVAIARSLINHPKLILADEPTGNLDSDSGDAILALIRGINRDRKTAFIIVTHDRHIAAATDRVIEIADGRIVRDFPTADRSDTENWSRLAPGHCRFPGEACSS